MCKGSLSTKHTAWHAGILEREIHILSRGKKSLGKESDFLRMRVQVILDSAKITKKKTSKTKIKCESNGKQPGKPSIHARSISFHRLLRAKLSETHQL